MPVTTIVISIVLGAVLVQALRRRRVDSRWATFAGWVLAGFLSGLSSISFAIGLLVLPFALVAIVVASRVSAWPAGLGFVGGIGLVGILVAVLSFGEQSGPDHDRWLLFGVVLTAVSIAAFAVARAAHRT